MTVLTRLDLAGTVTAVLASPDRRTGLERARHERLTLTFDGIAVHVPPQCVCRAMA